jgi:RimJ/RimL family protein N-acetyltransferase
MAGLALRDVVQSDIPTFFDYQLDATANHMAAFTSEDPSDGDAFRSHWSRLLSDGAIRKQAILFDGRVAGHIASYERAGGREVTYWIGRMYWGKGLASGALAEFLHQETTRPLYARAAKDNVASLRVLRKCGFATCGEDRGFSNARREQVEEYVLMLGGAGRGSPSCG